MWEDVLGEVLGGGEGAQLKSGNDKCSKHGIDPARKRFAYHSLDRVITITQREREVLELIVTGLTVKKAAIAMGLSPRTAEFYVKTLRYKFKCASKRDLIEFVVHHHVLEQLVVSYF